PLDAVRHFLNLVKTAPPTVTKLRYPDGPILIDAVFFQMYQTGIARVWKHLLEQWSKEGFAKQLLVLDRQNSAPRFPNIRYRTLPPFDYATVDADRQMLQSVCDEERAALFISTYYTTPITTPSVFM